MIKFVKNNLAFKKVSQCLIVFLFSIQLYQIFSILVTNYIVFLLIMKNASIGQIENINTKFVQTVKSMYTTVKSCIRYNSTYSNFFYSHIGFKQGDLSSPMIFMFFVDELIDNINTDLEGIFTINEINLFLILFADDQILFAKSSRISTGNANRY